MIHLLEEHQDELAGLCRKYRVNRLEVFGSAARGDFDPATSDIDFLVQFNDLRVEDAADRYLGLLVDLEDLFSRKIDLVNYLSIRNPYFKQVVDRSRVRLYAA